MTEELALSDHHFDFYQHMRDSIRVWLKGKGAGYRFSEYLLAAPDLFHLLCKVVVDKDVPARHRAELAVAVVYVVCPVDLLPEAFAGAVGYADDVVVAALALNRLVNEIDAAVVTRHWAGDTDVLELIRRILEVASEMVGILKWEQIRKDFDESEGAVA